jgi:hypothetical protein
MVMLGGFWAGKHFLVLIKECDHMQQSFSGEPIKLVVDQVRHMELRYLKNLSTLLFDTPRSSNSVLRRFAS